MHQVVKLTGLKRTASLVWNPELISHYGTHPTALPSQPSKIYITKEISSKALPVMSLTEEKRRIQKKDKSTGMWVRRGQNQTPCTVTGFTGMFHYQVFFFSAPSAL